MAKKKSNEGGFNWAFLAGFCAFIALVITGVEFFIVTFNIGSLDTVFQMISKGCLIAAVALSAWAFVKKANLPGGRTFWTVIFAVLTVLAALSIWA